MPFAGIGEIHQPAQGQSELAIRRNFQRHLIGGAADAAGLNFQARLGVVNRALQNFQRVGCGILFGDLVEGAVNDPLGGRSSCRLS